MVFVLISSSEDFGLQAQKKVNRGMMDLDHSNMDNPHLTIHFSLDFQ